MQTTTMEVPPREAADPSSWKDRMALRVTYVNIVLYALCYQLQRPVEPFLVKSLSSKDSEHFLRSYGQLQSFFNTVQTVGSPLVGILLDRLGIQIASVIVFAATALSYAILASASDMRLLFWSKVPTIFQAAFLVAQATAATSTGDDSAARARALGRMTTAYTIGATIGPTLGGYLADRGDLYFSARLAVVGSLVSVVLSFLFLPTGDRSSKEEEENQSSKPSFFEALRHSGTIARRPSVLPLLMVKLVGGVVASMHSTALPLILTEKVHFEPSQLGLSMSASMIAVAFFGSFCMAPLAGFVGPDGMTMLGLSGRAIMGPVMAIIVSVASGNDQVVVLQVALASVLHALSAHTLATGLTTQTTGAVGKEEQGTLLGLEHSIFSLARIAGPPLGTMLLAFRSVGGFWLVAGACCVVDLVLVIYLFSSSPSQPKKTN